jgi:hypothetical protein
MNKRNTQDSNNLNERIDNLNKTIQIRKTVLDKMIKKLQEKDEKREKSK